MKILDNVCGLLSIGIIAVFEFILAIVVIVLDSTYFQYISQSLQFTNKQVLDTSISLNAVSNAIIVFGVFYCVAIMMITILFLPRFSRNYKHDDYGPLMIVCSIQALSLILIETVRHPLFYTYISCINDYYQDMLRGRAACAIVMMIAAFIIAILCIRLIKLSDNIVIKVLTIITYVICLVIPLVMISINIASFVVLLPGNTTPVQPSDIKVGLFNKTDVISIHDGQYNKDNFYSTRILTNVDSIIRSPYKRYAYTFCTGGRSRSCTNYYFRITLITIDCSDSKNKLFYYEDCLNATKLYLKIEYLDDKSRYPVYNCAKETSSTLCEIGCSSLLRYEMIMIQEYNDTLKYAWNNFSSCTAQPSVIIPYEITVDPCSMSPKYVFNSVLVLFMLLLYCLS